MLATTHRVTIVSGLPRSGTSLMMQMLAAGGVPALTDGLRRADTDNPRGYYEFERVKQIKTDHAWLADARGKAVKMVHLLLLDLPVGTQADIVFMRRDLGEVARSQAAMLQRAGKGGAGLDDARLAGVYRQQIDRVLAAVGSRAELRLIELDYAEVVGDPAAAAARVAGFLERAMDVEAMAVAVDPELYRNRRG